MWTACSVSTISVLDCPQIMHLAGADKAPPKWLGGHNFTTEVDGRYRLLCPSKCNFRLSLQCCQFPGSGMLWINLKNMGWEIAPAVLRAETPHGFYFRHIVKTCMVSKCIYRISHLNRLTAGIILFWQGLPADELLTTCCEYLHLKWELPMQWLVGAAYSESSEYGYMYEHF